MLYSTLSALLFILYEYVTELTNDANASHFRQISRTLMTTSPQQKVVVLIECELRSTYLATAFYSIS